MSCFKVYIIIKFYLLLFWDGVSTCYGMYVEVNFVEPPSLKFYLDLEGWT